MYPDDTVNLLLSIFGAVKWSIMRELSLSIDDVAMFSPSLTISSACSLLMLPCKECPRDSTSVHIVCDMLPTCYKWRSTSPFFDTHIALRLLFSEQTTNVSFSSLLTFPIGDEFILNALLSA